MKHKKFSEAMLCGFEKVDGRQWFGDYCPRTDKGESPASVCVLGAVNLCLRGNARRASIIRANRADPLSDTQFASAFREAWGMCPDDLNDDDQMPWEHIYGMAKAAGL